MNITRAFNITLNITMLSTLLFAPKAMAEEPMVFWKDWQFNGFGTVGYIESDKYDDRVPRRALYQDGRRIHDNGLLMDSRLGFQVKGDLTDHWSVVGQIVAREQYGHELDDYIDIAFARYQATNGWQVSFGRQAFDLFFLSDHRNTGYSYEWVRPPTQFYGFMPYESFDGLKVVKDWGDFDDQWQWSFSTGKVASKFISEVYSFGDSVDSLKSDPVYGTELLWASGYWRVRANFALFKFAHDLTLQQDLADVSTILTPIWPEFKNIVHDFTKSSIIRYGSLGVAWEKEDWKVQAEWNTVDSDFMGFNGQRGYLHLSKRFGQWQPFVTASFSHDSQVVKYDSPPPGYELEEFHYEVETFIKGMRHNEHAIGLGVRWDFAAQKALKVQCDKYYFEADSGSVYGRVDQLYLKDEQKSWCSVAVDWVF